MEQKTAPVSKRRLWSVYVFVEREIQEGRIIARSTRLGKVPKLKRIMRELKTVVFEHLYLNVSKMFKKQGILYIYVGVGKNKEVHRHDMKSVVGIQIREYKRSGVQ